MHTVKRKSTLARAIASEQIAVLHKVQVQLDNTMIFVHSWENPLAPEARAWLQQHAGKGTSKRPSFDAHAKFRWYWWFPQAAMDYTSVSGQPKVIRRYYRPNSCECGEFWFKDAAPAMLFKLTFGG